MLLRLINDGFQLIRRKGLTKHRFALPGGNAGKRIGGAGGQQMAKRRAHQFERIIPCLWSNSALPLGFHECPGDGFIALTNINRRFVFGSNVLREPIQNGLALLNIALAGSTLPGNLEPLGGQFINLDALEFFSGLHFVHVLNQMSRVRLRAGLFNDPLQLRLRPTA